MASVPSLKLSVMANAAGPTEGGHVMYNINVKPKKGKGRQLIEVVVWGNVLCRSAASNSFYGQCSVALIEYYGRHRSMASCTL